MEKYEEVFQRMIIDGINPKDFEKWLHEKNLERSYSNNNKYFSSTEDTKIYFCYQSGRECAQHSSREFIEGIRIGSRLRIRPQVAHQLMATEAIDFAQKMRGHLLSGKDLEVFASRIADIRIALAKCGVEELDFNFIWTAEGALIKDMNLRRLRDASICLTASDSEDSKGAVIVVY